MIQNSRVWVCFLMVFLFSTCSMAVEPVYTGGFFSNTAIKGYDTVAYFTQGKAVKGKQEFTAEYKSAKWLFSSAENRALFQSSPEKYAPQYGGYCAYAVAQNATASIKPELFTIYNGKLYLNYNNAINDKWLKEKERYIQEADKNWPKLIEQ